MSKELKTATAEVERIERDIGATMKEIAAVNERLALIGQIDEASIEEMQEERNLKRKEEKLQAALGELRAKAEAARAVQAEAQRAADKAKLEEMEAALRQEADEIAAYLEELENKVRERLLAHCERRDAVRALHWKVRRDFGAQQTVFSRTNPGREVLLHAGQCLEDYRYWARLYPRRTEEAT